MRRGLRAAGLCCLAALCAACTSTAPATIRPSIITRINPDVNGVPYDMDLFMQDGGLMLDSLGHRMTAESLLQMASSKDDAFQVRISFQGDATASPAPIKQLQYQLLSKAKSERLIIHVIVPFGKL